MEDSEIQIGKKLRDAREAAGYTIADVVHRAHLPRSVVEALEAEDFSVFTSPTYAKSFLNQYSGYLGVDAQPWLNALEPASFVQTEGLQSIFETVPAGPRIEKPKARKDPSSSAFSTIVLMVVTGGLCYGAYKGWQYAEKNWGQEIEAVDTRPLPKTEFPSNEPSPKQVIVESPAAPRAMPVEQVVVRKPDLLPGVTPKALPVNESLITD